MASPLSESEILWNNDPLMSLLSGTADRFQDDNNSTPPSNAEIHTASSNEDNGSSLSSQRFREDLNCKSISNKGVHNSNDEDIKIRQNLKKTVTVASVGTTTVGGTGTDESSGSGITNGAEMKETMKTNEEKTDLSKTGSRPNSKSSDKEEIHENGVCKQKKGISFPKGTYISGYFEPPDPWKNAPTWTTDELISAYKKSCELHATKPIIKVLQQLHGISAPGRREPLLSLKGEKLDQKQCESLEEILRRVQFKLVDLEASHLDDECAVALFDMIEYYESACQLNISCNKNIGARGWQACSRLVRRTPSLTYIDMRGCEMSDRTIPIFGRALKLGCHLTILHMEAMNLSGRPLVILVAALKMNETLQELFLAENKFMPTDGVQLGNLMRFNHKLNLLDLRNNHLQDIGTSHLCDGLLEQTMGCGLRTLVLWNNSISYQAMPVLGRVLAQSESLETLNVGHNPITNEGVHLLKDGLLKTNTLLRLGLQGTKITDEGAVAIAEYIADSMILLRIDLRDNDIKTGGLMALSHAMRVNNSVTRIDLDKDTKKEPGMRDYAEQQSRLQRDILTFQQRNVQAAVEREEQERARLEEKAEAAAMAQLAEEEEQANEAETSTSQNLPSDISNTESFTLIGEEEAADKSESQDEKSVAEASDSSKPKLEKSLSTSPTSDAHAAALSSPKEQHQRPSHLLYKPELHPQESLDSPFPADEESMDSSFPYVSSTPTKPVEVEKPALALPVGIAPTADMLLSPQYYPRQLAKKIFSVSRVSEEGGCTPPLSTSPLPHPLADAFTPINVSNVELPSTSTHTAATSHLSTDNANSCDTSCVDISPGTLVKDLAEETVKQMVSSSEQSLLTEATSSSSDTDTAILARPLDNSSGEPSEAAVSTTEGQSALQQDLENVELSNSETAPSTDSVCEESATEAATFAQSVVISETPQNDSISEPSKSEFHNSEDNQQQDEASTKDSEPSETEPSIQLEEETSNGDTLTTEANSEADSLPASHVGAGNVVPSTTDTPAQPDLDRGSVSSGSIEDDLTESDPSSLSQLQEESARADTDENDSVNSFHGESESSINVTEDSKMADEASTTSTAPSVQIEDETTSPNVDSKSPLSLVTDPENNLEGGSNFTEAAASAENIDSLDEEPWLAVDREGNPAETKGPAGKDTEKQPDFFTTLSMNGLTQELASALTSLDGSTAIIDDDDNDDDEEEEEKVEREAESTETDCHVPDEFERELDAMLAQVKNDSWPLKES